MASRQIKRIQLIVPIFFFTCFTHVSAFSFAFTNQQGNQFYEDALRSFHQADLKAAVILLKNSLKNSPHHLPSKILMAEILIAQGNGSAAEIELLDAEKSGADEKRILPLLLETYLLQKKYAQVISRDFPVGSNKRLKSKISMLKGRALVGQKKLISAEQLFNQALSYYQKNVLAILGRAQVALLRENIKQALTYTHQALELSPTNSNALLMLANLEQMQGNVQAALIKTNEILALNRENFPALLMRAGLLIDKGDYQAALIDVEVIISLIPNEPRANYLKFIINIALGNEEESEATINHLNTVLTGMPEDVMKDNPVYYYLAGLISYGQGEYLKAQKALRKYYDINKSDTRALKLLAKAELRLNEPFAAKSYLVKARLINPDDTEIWSLLGRAYMATGSQDKAERYFLDVIEKQTAKIGPLVDLAKLYLGNGQFSKAIRYLEQAKALEKESDENPKLYLLLTQAYKENKQITQALDYANRLVLMQPNDSFLQQLKGSLLGLNGDHENARISFEKALSLNPKNHQAVIHLARMDMLSGQIQQAITRLQTQLTSDSSNTGLMIELGNNYFRLNDQANALLWYEKAYALDNNNSTALRRLVEYNISIKNTDKALALVEEYLKRYSKNADMQLIAAELYLGDKQNNKAINAHQIAVKFSANKAVALLKLAKTQRLLGNVDAAIVSLEKATSWDNEFIGGYLQLIDIYNNENDFSNAMRYIDRLDKVTVNKSLIASLQGDTYRIAQQYPAAITAYQGALKAQASQLATLGLYRVFSAQGKYPKAITLLELWMKQYPEDLIVAIALADSYKKQGQLAKAGQFYDQLLSRFPDTPVLLNNAASIQVALSNLDKAAKYADIAYQRLPDNVAIIDTKAWIATLQGNYQQALPLYRQALALDVENIEVQYHLAVTLNKMNRNEEAIKYLQDVLASEQVYSGKVQAKALLKNLQK